MTHLSIFIATAGMLVVSLFALGAFEAGIAVGLQAAVIVAIWRSSRVLS
jgi:hypothetical protein